MRREIKLRIACDVEQTKYNNCHTAVDIFFALSLNQQQSNEMFSLFLDETMTYSCGIFKVRTAAFQLSNVVPTL